MPQFFFIDMILTLVLVLVNVAFVTLLERKVLSYSQLRLGPNKPSFGGILQPGADAIKLFSTKSIIPYLQVNFFLYAPFVSLFLVLIMWTLLPNFNFSVSFSFSAISLLVLMSVTVYPVLLAGWASNSKYSELGSLRNIAQTISYEVSLALLIMTILLLMSALSFSEMTFSYLNLFSFTLVALWLVVIVAETNRTPFDFAEGESELVSGFNTEYSGNKFAVVFMAEYASIYFFSSLTVLLFMSNQSMIMPMLSFCLIFFWIWLRATLPRYRYDKLMSLNWKIVLPISLIFVMFLSLSYCWYNKI